MKVIENGIVKEYNKQEYQADCAPSSKEVLIKDLKQNLTNTDYKAIKYAEGLISDEEYAETKALRQEWRDEINRLESEGEGDGVG